MGKLFKLKDWLTLDETARHLSTLFEEAVTVADVLRLGLDGHLTISVDFVNHARAKLGKIVPFKDVPLITLPRIGPDMKESSEMMTIVSDGSLLIEDVKKLREDTRFVQFDENTKVISGVWNLSMRGVERLDVEHSFQQLTGGPAVELVNIDGCYVSRPDGTWASLQSQFADEVTQDADGKKKTIRGDDYPAGRLPDDCVWVVRTDSLRAFERTTLDADSLQDAPFFDADAEDYPYLLHIAVRAWEDVRHTATGTPKQRVLNYLESKYPTLPQGTRDAIAQVVNWQRAGGRPARKLETGG